MNCENGIPMSGDTCALLLDDNYCICQLVEVNEELRALLRPLAAVAEFYERSLAPDDEVIVAFRGKVETRLTVGHCRRVREILERG